MALLKLVVLVKLTGERLSSWVKPAQVNYFVHHLFPKLTYEKPQIMFLLIDDSNGSIEIIE